MPPRSPLAPGNEDPDSGEEAAERRRNKELALVMLDEEKSRRMAEAAMEAEREKLERKATEQYVDALMEKERMRRIQENAYDTYLGEREVEEARRTAITQVDAWADLEKLRRAAQGLEFSKEERDGRLSAIQYARQQAVKEQDERVAAYAAGIYESRVAEKQSKIDNVRVATEAAEQERQRRVNEVLAMQKLQEWERLNNQRKADHVAEIERTRRVQEDPQERDFQWKRSRLAALALEAASSPRHSHLTGKLHSSPQKFASWAEGGTNNDKQDLLPAQPDGGNWGAGTSISPPPSSDPPDGMQNPLLGLSTPFGDGTQNPLQTVQQQVLGYLGTNNLPPMTSPFETSSYAMFTKSLMDTFSSPDAQQNNLFHTGTTIGRSPSLRIRTDLHDNHSPPPPLEFPQILPPNMFFDPVLYPNPLFNLSNASEPLLYPPYTDQPELNLLNQPYPAGFSSFGSCDYPVINDQDYDESTRCNRKARKMTRERQKRVKMNHKFEQLCQMLRLGHTARIEKITILTEAIRSVKQLLRENQFLKSQTMALVARLQQARLEKGSGRMPSFLLPTRSASASSDFGKLSLTDSNTRLQTTGQCASPVSQSHPPKPNRHIPSLSGLQADAEEDDEESESDEEAESKVPLVIHDSPSNRFRILDEDNMNELVDPHPTSPNKIANGHSRDHSLADFLRSTAGPDHFDDTSTTTSSCPSSLFSPFQTSATLADSTSSLENVFRNSSGDLFGQEPSDPSNTTARFVPHLSVNVNHNSNITSAHDAHDLRSPFSITPNPLITPTDAAFEHSKDLFNFISANDPVPFSLTQDVLSPMNSPGLHPPPDPLGLG